MSSTTTVTTDTTNTGTTTGTTTDTTTPLTSLVAILNLTLSLEPLLNALLNALDGPSASSSKPGAHSQSALNFDAENAASAIAQSTPGTDSPLGVKRNAQLLTHLLSVLHEAKSVVISPLTSEPVKA